MDKYWMVHAPNNMQRDNPIFVHNTKESAITEATRLMRKHNTPISILELVIVVRPVDTPAVIEEIN